MTTGTETSDPSPRPPSRVLRDLEPVRSLWELAAHAVARAALPLAPRGDQHGVLVLPGFMAADATTWPLRDVLQRLGYEARPWGLGRNLGPTTRVLRGLTQRLRHLHTATGQRVTLVGVSLGGVLARDLAHDLPDLVRQVVTLGSPFGLPADSSHRNLTHAAPLYRALQPWHAPQPWRSSRPLAAPLPVPSTAVYTRSDGIVPWTSCVQPDSPRSESVEVWGSHSGLGHNPLALAVIADRLAQPADTWEPFRWEQLTRDARTRIRSTRIRSTRRDADRPDASAAA